MGGAGLRRFGAGCPYGKSRSTSCSQRTCGMTHDAPGRSPPPSSPDSRRVAVSAAFSVSSAGSNQLRSDQARRCTARSTRVASRHSLRRAGRSAQAADRARGTPGSGRLLTKASTTVSHQMRSQAQSEASASTSASRSSTSVHACPVRHCAPHAADLRPRMGGGGPGSTFSLDSPSGTRTRSGRSMPSANTAAEPGWSETTWRDCSSLRFMAAPTSDLSSSAGSRCTTFSAVFLTTSEMSLVGICSATTMPSPYALISASSPASSSTAWVEARPWPRSRSRRCASSITMT